MFPTLVWTAPTAIAFVYERTVEDVTSTWIEQPPFAGRAPPLLYVRVVAPAFATTLAAVHPLPRRRFGTGAMARPGPGNVSTRSAVSVAAVRLPFEIVRESFEMPPAPMTDGKNDFATLGGWNGLTNRRSVAGAALFPAFV